VQNADFNIYPNPFLDEITLIFRNPEVSTEEIEIFNPKGERVFAAAANDFRRTLEIKNLQNLPAGVYMVKVKSENQVYVQKLIKL
jgi:methionine-rich copper-binding protein CopC